MTLKLPKGRAVKRATHKAMALSECRTLDEVCRLDRDNFQAGSYWLSADGETVSVTHQAMGEPVQSTIDVPRREFNKLVSLYLRPRRIVRR